KAEANSKGIVAAISRASTKGSGDDLTLHRHADAAADAVRTRYPRVRLDDPIDRGADIAREGRGFAQTHVDMHRHVFRGRRQPSFARVPHLLERVQAFVVGPEQKNRNL